MPPSGLIWDFSLAERSQGMLNTLRGLRSVPRTGLCRGVHFGYFSSPISPWRLAGHHALKKPPLCVLNLITESDIKRNGHLWRTQVRYVIETQLCRSLKQPMWPLVISCSNAVWRKFTPNQNRWSQENRFQCISMDGCKGYGMPNYILFFLNSFWKSFPLWLFLN